MWIARLQMPTNRVVAREILFRQPPVDDDGIERGTAVRVIEIAAGQNGDAECREIPGTDRHFLRQLQRTRFVIGLSFGGEGIGERKLVWRQADRQRYRLNPGQAVGAAQKFIPESNDGFVIPVERGRQRDLRGEDVVAVEPRIYLLEADKAADQQHGTNQQHQGKRELGYNQYTPRTQTGCTRARARGVAEGSVQRSTFRMKRGCQPEQNA